MLNEMARILGIEFRVIDYCAAFLKHVGARVLLQDAGPLIQE
jgi:hypothetical protein